MISINLEMKNEAIKKLKDKNKMTEVIEKALDLVEKDLMRAIQINAAQADFKKTSGKYIRDIKTERKKGLLHIFSTHPAALAIEYGFKETRPMTWLIDANTPTGAIAFKVEGQKQSVIRLVTKEAIGRPSSTAKSGLSWTYPVMEGKFIFTNSLKQTMPAVRKHLSRIFKIIVED